MRFIITIGERKRIHLKENFELVQADFVTMSSASQMSSTAESGFEYGSVNRNLIAICGIGASDAKNTRGAYGLWKNIVENELVALEMTNGESSELAINEETTQSTETKPTSAFHANSIDKDLSEVAYGALQDGAETNYSGEEALVGCFVTALDDDTLHLGGDASSLTALKEEPTAISKLAQKYNLRGSR